MKVLVACEESQRVCTAFRGKGHEAYSCDILECSGGHPEWHIQGDVLEVVQNEHKVFWRGKYVWLFMTGDENVHLIEKWDLIIAHPPCTYLTLAGNKWFKPEFAERFPDRQKQRKEAVDFFMAIANADCDKIAIENPVGVMSSQWRKPDQYIEPYMFGDPEKKKTGLWLKGLPLLKPTNIVEPVIIHCKSGANEPRWHMETMRLPKEERSRVRSQTFTGIASAFAEQWG
jgi:site-specific DNA-cytosine methylase